MLQAFAYVETEICAPFLREKRHRESSETKMQIKLENQLQLAELASHKFG